MTVFLILLGVLQALLATPVLLRFIKSIWATRIRASTDLPSAPVSVVVPVLNEEDRLAQTMETITAEGEEVAEILVVDGGSVDRTEDIVQSFAARDARVRFVDASPIPQHAVGKAWGLRVGVAEAKGEWVLTLDADTVIENGLVRALCAHVRGTQTVALSVATQQRTRGAVNSLLHPAFLATLVYRFGSPGYETTDPDRVMANGQCFFASKQVLTSSRAIDASLSSLCEDISIVRTLAQAGHEVGFYESDVPVVTEMYSSAIDLWHNWPRSLAMRDRHFTAARYIDFLQLALVQALPLPLLVLSLALGSPVFFAALQAGLVLARVGVLFGMRRAYAETAATFWLSPLADLPAVMRIVQFALRRRFSWRGCDYIRTDDGQFQRVQDH